MIRCRCSRCRRRRTLAQHPGWYVQRWRVRCRCGGEFRPDRHRNTVELVKRGVCWCDAYWFPHRPVMGRCDLAWWRR